MIPLASCDASASTNGLTWPKKSFCGSFQSSWQIRCNGAIDDPSGIIYWWHLWHYMTNESHIAPHFNCLDLRNALIPLMTLLSSCDTNTGANGVTWQKLCHWWYCFHCMTPMLVLMASWPKRSCCTSFWLSWPGKCSGSIDSAISIMWCWHWHQWHHVTKKVMLHLISIALT